MLTLGQLDQISRKDPRLYETLRAVVDAVNKLNMRAGIDPKGQMAAPDKVGSLSVTAADGIFDAAITDNSPVTRGIHYFLEYDTSSQFTQPVRIELGSVRNWRGMLGNRTLFWRAYSQYHNSPPSAAVAFGNPPTGVVGGGGAGPALQPSQGGGTSAGIAGGSGFGIEERQRAKQLR